MYTYIKFHARLNPDNVALGFGRGVISYSRLANLIASVSQKLLDNGITKQNTASIDAQGEILEELIIGLALSAIGAGWVSRKNLALGKIPSNNLTLTRSAGDVENKLLIDDSWYEGGLHQSLDNNDNHTWFITSTSGATGAPKSIHLSNQIIKQRALLHPSAYGNDVMSRNAGTLLPLGFPFGLMSSISPLLRGGTLVLNSGSLDDPESNLCNIEHLTVSPQIFSLLLEDPVKFSRQFRSLKSVMLSGSSVPDSLVNKFRQNSNLELFSSYGASEVGPVANMRLGGARLPEDAAGYIYPWVEVQSVSEDGKPLAAGQEGILRIKTPYMIHEYHDDPVATEQVFVDGWFYPGDVGFISNDNLLYVTGRMDELINIGGLKISPDKIEATILEHPEVRDAAVFHVEGKSGIDVIWAAVSTVHNRPIDFRKLNDQCIEHFGVTAAPKKFFHVGTIPRTETGKIQRGIIKEILMKGANNSVH